MVGNIAPIYAIHPNDNKIRLKVTQTLAAADPNEFDEPEDVEVFIKKEKYRNTEQLTRTQDGNNSSNFVSSRNFVDAESSYELIAYAPGFDTIRAKTYIPKASKIKNYRVSDYETNVSETNDNKININYKVSLEIDHADDVGYYHLAFFNEYDNQPNTWFVINPEYQEDKLLLPHFEFGILIDGSEISKDQVLEFQMQDYLFTNQKVSDFWVELRSVTEEYFLYHESLARQKLVRWDPFAQPVQIYNNIENGRGNFAGYNVDYLSVKEPE